LNSPVAVSSELRMRLAAVRILVCDVDGTLTDGTVVFDSAGNEARAFHIQDGLGMVAAAGVGLRTVWISGRDSPVVRRRAEELRIARLMQGVRDKSAAVKDVVDEFGVSHTEIAFIGDDINDIPGMKASGISLCPEDASQDVLATADWVLHKQGGRGAVREAIELILSCRGEWELARDAYLANLTVAPETPGLLPPTQ
jgi:3-deoxy-D-manno-octulosonate 8-phosphate phosphatase (KDO 8-P phosphatase)